MKESARILCMGAIAVVMAFGSGCSKSDNERFDSLLEKFFGTSVFFSTDSVPSYARYGDYLSTQMVTNRTFGYGMYICEFRAADGPTCSTFWLYSNEPSVKCLPDVAQNWRWNEIDFEFVPYTRATQSQYYTFNGGLPNPTEIKKYGTSLNFGDPRAQDLSDTSAASWTEGKMQTDETIAHDMFDYFNVFMVSLNGGLPTGGTFTLRDVSGDSSTSSLPWNATAAALKTALDGLNGGRGLFNMKDKYTVSSTAAGGPGDIETESLNVIRNISSGLIGQLSAGETVTSVGDPSIITSGTTILSVDTSGCTVTLSQDATKATTGQTFNYVPQGAWSITFTTAPDAAQTLTIDYSSLEPAGTLGKVIVGKTTEGVVTGMNISVFQPYKKPGSSETWWDLLVSETGDGKVWAHAMDWKYPLIHIQTPSSLDMSKMVTMNFWRSPTGDRSQAIDFGSGGWGTVTHTGILRETPIPGTAGHADYFTSAVLNNEAYVFDSTGDYDPTGEFHTYTIVWTSKRMAQYIDAPDGGRDISDATPVAVYTIGDFPSLDHSGHQAPGAAVPWIGTQLNQPIGNVTMNLANYVAFMAASTGNNDYAYAKGTLTNGNTTVANLSILDAGNLNPGVDLVNKGISGDGIQPGTTITAVDLAKKTLTLSAAASLTGTGTVILTMGMDVLSGSITSGNAIISIPALDEKKVSVGQLVLGAGIQTGATVTAIDTVGKQVTMDLAATATSASAQSFVFQTTPSGNGWSGPPPGASFTSADAYVRTIGFFPLTETADHENPTSADFVTDTSDPGTFWVDFTDESVWTEDTFNQQITKYFSILYARDFTKENAIPGEDKYQRDAKSPMNVTFLPPLTAGGKGCMRLRCSLSQKETVGQVPVRNFFVLQASQKEDAEISGTNPLVRVEIASKDDPDHYYAATSSVTTPSAFYAPPAGTSVDVTVKVWVATKGYYDPVAGVYDDPAPDYTAEVTLHGPGADGTTSCYWESTDDCHKVVADAQSANPHLITAQSPAAVCP